MVQFFYDFVWNRDFGWGLLFVGALALTALVGMRWQVNPPPSGKQNTGNITT